GRGALGRISLPLRGRQVARHPRSFGVLRRTVPHSDRAGRHARDSRARLNLSTPKVSAALPQALAIAAPAAVADRELAQAQTQARAQTRAQAQAAPPAETPCRSIRSRDAAALAPQSRRRPGPNE